MKKPQTYEPYLADWGEADMEEVPSGSYVSYFDYMELLKKYESLKKKASGSKEKPTKKK